MLDTRWSVRCAVLPLIATALALAAPAPGQGGPLIFEDGFELGTLEGWGSDEQMLRNLVAAAPPDLERVEQILRAIARRSGLPVATAGGTLLFATPCGSVTTSLGGDFNGWTPTAMEHHGALCWAELAIPSPAEAAYRYHDGSSWVADPLARRYRYDVDGEASLVRSDAAHLERWLDLGPELGLAPRELEVLVPAGGVFTHALYLHDGQNVFDPDALFGGWQLQTSLPPGILAVAIHNTSERFFEYTPFTDDLGGGPLGGGGSIYADLVHTVIRPLVEKRYGPAARTGLLGSTLGGLISLYVAQSFPGAYDFAASMSGTLGWGSFGPHNETIIELAQAAGHGTTALYLDSGGDGTCSDDDGDGIEDDGADTDNYCTTAQMKATLESVGYELDTDLWYTWDVGASSNEAVWAQRVDQPLAIFAGM